MPDQGSVRRQQEGRLTLMFRLLYVCTHVHTCAQGHVYAYYTGCPSCTPARTGARGIMNMYACMYMHAQTCADTPPHVQTRGLTCDGLPAIIFWGLPHQHSPVLPHGGDADGLRGVGNIYKRGRELLQMILAPATTGEDLNTASPLPPCQQPYNLAKPLLLYPESLPSQRTRTPHAHPFHPTLLPFGQCHQKPLSSSPKTPLGTIVTPFQHSGHPTKPL